MHKDLVEEYAEVMLARIERGEPREEVEDIAASLADSLERAIALLRRANALYLPKRLSDEITEFLNEDPRGP